MRLPYPYDPSADCPLWLRFLAEVLEGDTERIRLLQEWSGYLLTPDTSLQRMLALLGDGGNGKSVALDLLTAMVGPDNVSHVPLENFGDRFQLTSTLGRLANIAAEVSSCDKVAEGPLKQFVGGDRMQFDRKYLSPVYARPTARLIVAMNNLPPFADRSPGLWRRMIVLPFRVTIEPERQDPQLASKLKAELPGIFNWALSGLRRLRQQGRFTEPRVCVEAREECRTEMNPARVFLAEQCEEDPAAEVATVEVYEAYRSWADTRGYRPFDNGAFGKEVFRRFAKVTKAKRGGGGDRYSVYAGLRLLLPQDPVPGVPGV